MDREGNMDEETIKTYGLSDLKYDLVSEVWKCPQYTEQLDVQGRPINPCKCGFHQTS